MLRISLSIVLSSMVMSTMIENVEMLPADISREMTDSISESEKNTTTNKKSTFRDGKIFFDDFFGSANIEAEEKEPLGNCSCDCGVVNQEIRIVGGLPTGVNRYPWMARLVYDGKFHCGASLISNDYVVTAAHCVRRLKRSKIRVILGDHDQTVTTDSGSVMRAVSSIVRHRHFDVNSYNHDIALLKLRKSVNFSKVVRPICLPPDGLDPAGMNGTVIGWGRTTEGGALASVVQEVQVPILTTNQCRNSKYKPSRITTNMLCAGKGVQDSCQGDSGGPLLVNSGGGEKYELAGIVSWGFGCGRPGYPGVYTRVTRYLDWVKDNMRDTCFCVS